MNANSIPSVNDSFCFPNFSETFHKFKSEQQTVIFQNTYTIKLV